MVQTLTDTSHRRPARDARDSALEVVYAAIESAADAIVVLDDALRVVLANRRFVELWGLPAGWERLSPPQHIELLTRAMSPPAEFVRWLDAVRSGHYTDAFVTIPLADGRVIESCATVYRVNGEAAGQVWSFRDVTLRERAARELRALIAVAETLNQTVAPDQALADGLACLTDLVGARSAWIWTLHGRCAPHLRVAHGSLPPPAPTSPCDCIRRLSEGGLAPPVAALCCACLAGPSHQTHASVPIYSAAQPVGIINLVPGADRPFDESDLRLFSAVAGQFAVAIERAQLFEEAREQHAAAEALRAAAAALGATLDPEVLLDRLAEQIPAIVPCDALRIMLVDGRVARVARSVAVRGDGPGISGCGATFDIARSPALRSMIETEEPVSAALGLDAPPLADPAADWIGIPVVAHGVVAAFLVLERRQPEVFRPRHTSRLVVLAVHAALALQNVRLYADVQHLATLDSLTGVSNRRHFFAAAARELERARRYGHTIAAIMLDVDRFKQVNDTFGHAAGDIVLREVASRCFASLRTDDVLGRYGGEEFAIVLPETSLPGAAQVAERLREMIANAPIVTDVGPVAVTVSLGVAAYESFSDAQNVGRLLDCADRALYAAKQAGRNRVVCWEE